MAHRIPELGRIGKFELRRDPAQMSVELALAVHCRLGSRGLEKTMPAAGNSFRRPRNPARRQAGSVTTSSIGRAPLRPDERPDVGRPAPRLEGRAGDRQLRPPRAARLLATSTSPAAPATSPSGWSRRAARARDATVCDINPDMLAVGARARRQARATTTASRSSGGQCRGAAVPGQHFDAYTIAFGIRNVPRIERGACRQAYRVLRPRRAASCAWNSPRRPAGLDRLYAFYCRPDPRDGHGRRRRRRGLPLSRRSIRRFPPPEAFASLIAQTAGFKRVEFVRLTGGVVAIHSGWKL